MPLQDPLEDAVVTLCGHVFCYQCLSEYLTKQVYTAGYLILVQFLKFIRLIDQKRSLLNPNRTNVRKYQHTFFNVLD